MVGSFNFYKVYILSWKTDLIVITCSRVDVEASYQAVLHARLALQSPWQYSDSFHEFHTIVSTHSKLSIYLDLAIEGLGAGGEGDDRR